ncbi:MAG TPA: hypothetical protein ENJ75_03220 [Candidatus Kaiserbacteria bacterium]|nr:hypothetical protein [Candidatus Kaiserbacteria bacterium]
MRKAQYGVIAIKFMLSRLFREGFHLNPDPEELVAGIVVELGTETTDAEAFAEWAVSVLRDMSAKQKAQLQSIAEK